MLAQEFINIMIPPLKPSDSVAMALNWMDEFHLRQMPVVEQGRYLGMLDETQIMESNITSGKVADFELVAKGVFVKPNDHFYEVVKKASSHHLQLVPIITTDEVFMGVVSLQDSPGALAQMFASQGPGAILVLAMKANDYSLAEIARLIESNQTKILSVFTSDGEGDNELNVTLKLNQEDVTRAVATLERFGYKVAALFQDAQLEEEDKDRLDSFFRFLNI
jgi:acetoin utilization protein AcuB